MAIAPDKIKILATGVPKFKRTISLKTSGQKNRLFGCPPVTFLIEQGLEVVPSAGDNITPLKVEVKVEEIREMMTLGKVFSLLCITKVIYVRYKRKMAIFAINLV